MPTLISRGTASARAFGLTGSNKGQLYTQTFTSNGTFTPMAGVTNIVTLVGRGGTAQGDYQDYLSLKLMGQVYNGDPGSGSSGSIPIPYSDITYGMYNVVQTFNAGGIQSGYFFNVVYFEMFSNNTYNYNAGGSEDFPYYTYPGTWGITATGNVLYPGFVDFYNYGEFGNYYMSGSFQQYGSDGTGSSALGYTFAGATLSGSYPNRATQTATPVTYNNIAVTPGTNYPIVVGAGGSVAISYIIP